MTLGEDVTEPDTVPVQTKVENWINQLPRQTAAFEVKDFGHDLEGGYMNSVMNTTDDSEFEKIKPNGEARIRRVSTIKRGQRPARLPRTSAEESFSSSSTSSASEAWLSQSQASNMKIATPHSLLNSSSSQYFFPETPTTTVYSKMEHYTSSYGKFEVRFNATLK